jgi:mannose-P-dolichol utilization defect protein 1
VVKQEFDNTECLKMLISRGLGVLIIAGATCVKLPQVVKIVKSGSAKGISFAATILELMAVTANGAYSFSKGFPFTSYGEAVTLSLQTSLIAVLILW